MNLTDKEFFLNCIDYNLDELKSIPDKAQNGQLDECKRIFASYIRKNIFPEKFFKYIGNYANSDINDETIQIAEEACNGYLTSCGRTHHFEDNNIDWEFNPTENDFKEWTYQLNRHSEWLKMARAYRMTKDRKFYDGFLTQFNSWIKQAIVPEDGTIFYETFCWRTIEAGSRQGMVWGEVFHSFYMLMSDDVIINWFKSVWQHGNRLYKDHAPYGNWLLIEMNGLMNIAVLYPWLKDSKKWFDFCEKILLENISEQFFDDGFHYELSTDYHVVAFNNFLKPLRLCISYGVKQQESFKDCVKKMLNVFIALMRPDGKTPSLNDGSFTDVKQKIMQVSDLEDFSEYGNWFLQNSNPPFTSSVLENSGIVAFRSGWNPDDTFVLFDCGQRGAGECHFHEDKLSVLLYANGKEILCEGNNYSYDSSEMRKYALSTRSHNTVRVDGHDQNRKINSDYFSPDLSKKSDFTYYSNNEVEFAKSVYDEGYGIEANIKATHERTIYFVKKNFLNVPFIIVIDRLTSEQIHKYEINWHLDVNKINVDGLRVYCDEVQIISKATANEYVDISYGRKDPEWQGWTANSTKQGDYRPVHNISYNIEGNNIKVTTVILPTTKDTIGIKKLDCVSDYDIDDCKIIFEDESLFDLSTLI